MSASARSAQTFATGLGGLPATGSPRSEQQGGPRIPHRPSTGSTPQLPPPLSHHGVAECQPTHFQRPTSSWLTQSAMPTRIWEKPTTAIDPRHQPAAARARRGRPALAQALGPAPAPLRLDWAHRDAYPARTSGCPGARTHVLDEAWRGTGGCTTWPPDGGGAGRPRPVPAWAPFPRLRAPGSPLSEGASGTVTNPRSLLLGSRKTVPPQLHIQV